MDVPAAGDGPLAVLRQRLRALPTAATCQQQFGVIQVGLWGAPAQAEPHAAYGWLRTEGHIPFTVTHHRRSCAAASGSCPSRSSRRWCAMPRPCRRSCSCCWEAAAAAAAYRQPPSTARQARWLLQEAPRSGVLTPPLGCPFRCRSGGARRWRQGQARTAAAMAAAAMRQTTKRMTWPTPRSRRARCCRRCPRGARRVPNPCTLQHGTWHGM